MLEEQVESFLVQKGFLVDKYKHWEEEKNYIKMFDLKENLLLLKDIPYINIYGTTSKTEFKIIIKNLEYEARIECKWQAEQGSVDEKFPYMYLNALRSPEENQIFIVDGGAYRPEALTWLKKVCDLRVGQIDYKNIKVMSFSEFMIFIEKKLKNK